jgi:hypothetical protein
VLERQMNADAHRYGPIGHIAPWSGRIAGGQPLGREAAVESQTQHPEHGVPLGRVLPVVGSIRGAAGGGPSVRAVRMGRHLCASVVERT